MKHIITTIILLFSIAVCHAQAITFLGHPVDGTMNELVELAESHGLEQTVVSDNAITLEGNYLGFSAAKVQICQSDKTGKVNRIIVNTLADASDVDRLKDFITGFLGRPKKVEDLFWDMFVWKAGTTELALTETESPNLIFYNHAND